MNLAKKKYDNEIILVIFISVLYTNFATYKCMFKGTWKRKTIQKIPKYDIFSILLRKILQIIQITRTLSTSRFGLLNVYLKR